MLKIRRKQMNVLNDHVTVPFRQRLHEFVAKNAPNAEELEYDVLQARISIALVRAQQHGITWESNLANFVLMTFQYGERFDEDEKLALLFEGPKETGMYVSSDSVTVFR